MCVLCTIVQLACTSVIQKIEEIYCKFVVHLYRFVTVILGIAREDIIEVTSTHQQRSVLTGAIYRSDCVTVPRVSENLLSGRDNVEISSTHQQRAVLTSAIYSNACVTVPRVSI